MRQLDDDRGRYDARRCRVAELCREQDEQRPEPLATGVDEVARGVGEQRVVALHRVAHQLLDGAQPTLQLPVERWVSDVEPHQRTNRPWAAWWARSRTGCGTMPSTTVTARPSATEADVRALGIAMVGASAAGSLKNIRTIT